MNYSHHGEDERKLSEVDLNRGSQDYDDKPGEETSRLLLDSQQQDLEEGPPASAKLTTPNKPVDNKPNKAIAWRDLPRKKQLVVITLTRLSEPLVQTSLQSYMFYQLKWFDPSLPDATISGQAGVLAASFTAAQFLTAMLWGRVADSSHAGRKTVVLIGLAGTMASCLGFGFSTSFGQALAFRCLGGCTNGNVGVLRTMISETVQDKKYQQRAFVLLPMTFNIGIIIGPIMGGLLADPARSYPNVFGKVELFRQFPYALPNLFSAFFLLLAAVSAWLCLEETLDARVGRVDWGREAGKKIGSALGAFFSRLRRRSNHHDVYERLATNHDDDGNASFEMMSPPPPSSSPPSPQEASPPAAPRRPRYTQRLPFRRIFTRNVTLTLLAHSMLALHTGTFNSLWFVFLSTPVYDPAQPGAPKQRLPFVFTGGLGLPPAKVGLAMSILGVCGITLQLFAYPTVSARLGTVRCLRTFLLCFPVAYLLAPFLALVPSSAPPPAAKAGVAMWASILFVLLWHVVGRTFALPNGTVLVNNCSPHPSVLGTLHGLAQSCVSAARTVGPVLCGYLYGQGLSRGVVGAAWWGLSGFAVLGWMASWLIREGNGHEIWLEGDEEDK